MYSSNTVWCQLTFLSDHDCDHAQHYWSDRPANDTVLEYARFEYGPEAANLVVDAIALLEQTYPAPLQCGELSLVQCHITYACVSVHIPI